MSLPILSRKKFPVQDIPLKGLQEPFVKVYNDAGIAALISVSDLDLDTDGKERNDIVYESTHQAKTSIDPNGRWCDSSKLNFIVLSGGLPGRHGGDEMLPLGCLCTVIYKGKKAHAIYADGGPKDKYGEGSIALHKALGFNRLKKITKGTNKGKYKIIDLAIDKDVIIVIYLGCKVSTLPCSQSQIDNEAQKLWETFNR